MAIFLAGKAVCYRILTFFCYGKLHFKCESACLFFQKAVFVHQWFEFGSEGGVGGFEGGEVGLRSGLFQGVADFIPACTALVEQVFVADFAFDVGPVEGLPQFQAFIIHGLGFFGEQAVATVFFTPSGKNTVAMMLRRCAGMTARVLSILIYINMCRY